MFKTKNDGKLAELESAVADAAREVAKTRQAHRDACQALADARANLSESPSSDVLSDVVSQIFDEAGQRSKELGEAMTRLAEAERQLTSAREAPQRAAVAQKLGGHQAKLTGIRNTLLPHLVALRDELWASCYDAVLGRMGGPDPANQAQLMQTVDALVLQLSDGRLDVFCDHLGAYANAVADGSYPANFGRNVIDHHADVRAWKETDEEIRKLTAVA